MKICSLIILITSSVLLAACSKKIEKGRFGTYEVVLKKNYSPVDTFLIEVSKHQINSKINISQGNQESINCRATSRTTFQVDEQIIYMNLGDTINPIMKGSGFFPELDGINISLRIKGKDDNYSLIGKRI